jgi:hypothetical protein
VYADASLGVVDQGHDDGETADEISEVPEFIEHHRGFFAARRTD